MPWWTYIYSFGQIYACLFLYQSGHGWQRPCGFILALLGTLLTCLDIFVGGIIINDKVWL